MVIHKKIFSWLLLSSLVITNLNFSYASWENFITPTTLEKQKVENEILKLQSNLFDTSKNYLEKFSSDFEKLSKYEEKWDMKFEFSLNEENIWKANANLNIKDYIWKANYIDSEVSWDISFKWNYTPVYWSWFEIDLNTFASLISKDWKIYSLFKDFDFKVTDENISKILEKIKNQYKDNKYIKLPDDESSQKVLEMIKNFNLKSFLSESEIIRKKPLLTTYKKSWDKFLLVPTKFACETYFELEKTLNFSNSWYTPTTCSTKTYEAFIKEFIKLWEIYIILWKENTLWFYTFKEDVTIDFTLKYNEEKINSIDFIITPDQKKYKNELFNLSFKNWELFKIFLKEWKNTINFDSKLDKNNNFISIGSYIKSDDINWKLELKYNKISWFYIIKEKSYDYYESKGYKLQNVYWIKITWNTTKEKKLEKLNLNFVGVDVKNKKTLFVWKTSFNNWNFKFNISSNQEYNKFKITWNWKIDNNFFDIKTNFNYMWEYNWNLDLLVDLRDNKIINSMDFNLNNKNQNQNLVKFKLTNNWTRIYKDDIKIEAPKDFKELNTEEVSEILYEYQLIKSRDNVRINDLKSLKSALEQSYQDNREYPTAENFKEKVSLYILKIPKDTLEWKEINWCKFWYRYNVWPDENWIENQKYKLSTCLEDGDLFQIWIKDLRLEDKYLISDLIK